MQSHANDVLVSAWQRVQPGLEITVSPVDDVYRFHDRPGRDPLEVLSEYLALGHEIVELIDQTLQACGVRLREVESLLDCGCGHGRGTRFLVHRLPPARITVCDRVPDAVAFHAARFGLSGVTDVALLGSARFEVITAIAIFGNLPETVFVSLLGELVQRLRPGGVLVLTTECFAERGDVGDTGEAGETGGTGAGFEYHPQSESSVLGPEVYGASRCSAEWFERTVRGIAGVAFVRRGRRALDRLQDVWAIGRAPRARQDDPREDAPLTIAAPPRIEIDSAQIDRAGRLTAAGWALDWRHQPVAALEVSTGAETVVPHKRPRPDVAAHFGVPAAIGGGFELAHDVRDRRFPRHVVVSARDGEGRRNLLAKRVTAHSLTRAPTEAEAAVLARQRRGREVLAYGGLFSVYAAEMHETGLYPHLAARAEGCRLWDASGREYLDWFLGWGPMLLGHRHPAVEAAIERQLRVAPALSLMHDLEIEVAERLTEMIPCAERVAFGKNGSDVTLAAVRVARAVTGREVVAACGYHGFHDWCMAQYAWCAGVPSVLRECLRTFPYNDLEALERLLVDERGRVAAVILEPTANELPAPGYLAGVKQLAREHGALLVFDEIVTGFRIARGGAQEAYGVVPDLATFGKALANGMPLSVLVGREEFMSALPRVGFGLTFRGELLSLAAAAACLSIFAREPVAEDVMRTGELVRARFTELARARAVPAVLQGFAGRMNFTFGAAQGISGTGLRTLWVQECLREGVLTNGMLLSCYAHDAAAVERTLVALDRALASLQRVLVAGVLEPFLDVPVTADFYEP